MHWKSAAVISLKKDPIYLEILFALEGGVGVVNLLQLHYAMISPTERKQQEEKKIAPTSSPLPS